MPRFGLTDLSETVRHELTLAWHRLDAWPDVTAALKRLAEKVFACARLERQHLIDGRPCAPK